MGDYQTNCYIVTINENDLIIDPGFNALPWIKQNVSNPIAILNTHGHFDHVWSNQAAKDEFNIKIYCPADDCFMLEKDPFEKGTPCSNADFKITSNEEIELSDIKIKFHHFPGHTPGCSAIEINDSLFSGDFIFQNSIGRVDFPYSNPSDMINSIQKVLQWEKDIIIYPGHGMPTTLNQERNSLNNWLNYL